MGNVNHRVRRGNHQPFHQVFQLPHVSGPLTTLQKVHHPGAQRQRLSVLLTEPGQEPLGDGGNVLRPVPERGHGNPDDVQPVKEIGPEAAPFHFLFQILIRRRNQPEIRFRPGGAGPPFRAPVLKKPEQSGLNPGGQFPDFVEKQGSVAGQGDFPQFSGVGRAGRGSALVPEQLRLRQVLI